MYHLIPKPEGLPKTTWIGRNATWTAYNDRIIFGLTWWRRDYWLMKKGTWITRHS